MNCPSRIGNAQIQRVGYMSANRCRGGAPVQQHGAAQKVGRVQISKDEVGIGYSWQPAAEGIGIAIRCMAATPEATYRVAVKSLVGFDQRAALAQITVPTLSIAGEVDPNAPADMMRKMAAKIPGGRFVVIPGVGHLPNLERPVEFNQILMSFLASLPETEWPA